jgi:hypothetical protein
MERLLSGQLGALALGIAGAVGGLPAAAQTPPCGTVVTQSIRLNADMHCTGNQPALVVGADNVRIDLNGYGIYGQLNWIFLVLNPPGIVAHGWQKVEVVGPGLIKDFMYDVLIFGGRGHQVSGITGESMAGIVLRGASDSRVLENVLISGVGVLDNMGPPYYAGGTALRNKIFKNRLGTPTQRGGYLAISGCLTSKNTATDNEIFGAAAVDGGAYGNVLEGNRITSMAHVHRYSVLLGEGYGNEVRDNLIDADGVDGILIEPQTNPACNTGQPGRNADDNLIYANVIRNGATGLHAGEYPFPPAPQGTQGTGNVILGNTFIDMTVRGQYFGAFTAYNDGRNNKYWNVPIEVEDFGIGNLWP